MAWLKASPNPIVVDLNQKTDGPSTVTYSKAATDELWRRAGYGGTWEFLKDPTKLPGFKAVQGTSPEEAGSFPMTLKPGALWDFGIFKQDHGPRPNRDEIRLAHLVLYAVGDRPKSDLIEHQDWTTGGTWHSHVLSTKVPTHAVVATASLSPPSFNARGFPRSGKPAGVTPQSFSEAKQFTFWTEPLLAGRDHTYLVIVIDAKGNWDFRVSSFTTKRRKITLQFKTLHVFNDGDENTVGEAEFEFGLQLVDETGWPVEWTETFTRPEADIDDWSETDRPYSLGFAHFGEPAAVQEDERVRVWSGGVEDDFAIFDDFAKGGVILNFPTGNGEKVSNDQFQIDCPGRGSDFHYGVDVVWSVEYKD